MKRTVFALLVFSCLGLSGCQVGQVATILNLSKSVIDLVDSFMKLHKDFTTSTTDVIAVTQKSFQSKENSLADVARFWDFEWNKMEDKYASLAGRLAEIRVASEQYFEVLSSNNRSINDTALRRMDFQRNEAKRQQWDVQYGKTVENLKKARILIEKGKDWVRVLANAAAREELDSFIKEMEKMSYTAQFTLPADVKNFEANARTIFKNE